MPELVKPADALTVDDLKAHPVWRFVNDDSIDETAVAPIKRVPVKRLEGKLVGTEVRLANGTARWALLGNLDTRNPRLTEHFRTISLERGGEWFHMARYHDYDYRERGPAALSRFLGMEPKEVFPIAVDLRHIVRPDDAIGLVFNIERHPREKLSRSKIIALAVSGD
jgi:hypothetical protein